ncbi:hypothetical protein GII36_02290 [Candidatus Mycosynbacter amalyticus]|uniref:Uncharacterized protein n=1 Tax=Candidatus Mycosynbacter amalyticus TaxID=2665156 RepID=A0A857MTC9_9BACT|nr:hypothetical protein [Candidatus Mycosynbacter amalyticus]QHN42677.1 hypothetical protein GII36_02290 [Candidatus Mycosynbacter amalyticus]
MSDYDNLNNAGNISELLGSLKTTVDFSEGDSDKKIQKMRDLLERAYVTIEAQQEKIRSLESSKIPSKDEVESMSAMLDVLNKLDIKTIDKLSELGSKEAK